MKTARPEPVEGRRQRAGDAHRPAGSAGVQTAPPLPLPLSGGALGAARFASLLSLLGTLALLGPEVFFISDSFGTRMNTVFKFQYHAWVLLGLVGTVGLAVWAQHLRPRVAGVGGAVVVGALALTLGAGYPVAATEARTGGFRGEPTLAGDRFLQRSRPEDYAAIQWLKGQPVRSPVVEAVGPDYQEFARVSTFSGHPTLMGWVGHELQWRGQTGELGRRQAEVDRIYGQLAGEPLLEALRRQRVGYVFFGSLERQRYGLEASARLGETLPVAFAHGEVTVYWVPQAGRGLLARLGTALAGLE